MMTFVRPPTAAIALALALGAAVAERASAQEQPQTLLPPGAAFLGIGASVIGMGNLDDRLMARGYPTFGSTATGINLGAYGILPGGLAVGAEWHGLIIGDAEHEGRDVGIGGGYGTLGVGYIFDLSPRVRVYPRFGIGGGGVGLWMESSADSVDFDDVLADPPEPAPYERDTALSWFGAVLDLGLGAELLPGGWARGLMFGVRLGYLAAPSKSDWQLHDRGVSGGPEASIAGPYIRATIGVAKPAR